LDSDPTAINVRLTRKQAAIIWPGLNFIVLANLTRMSQGAAVTRYLFNVFPLPPTVDTGKWSEAMMRRIDALWIRFKPKAQVGGLSTFLQDVKETVRGRRPFIRPRIVPIPRRASRAEIFQLTKPDEEDGEFEFGYKQRWLANIVVSVEPEFEIRERGMNRAEARCMELAPTFEEQEQAVYEQHQHLYHGPHTTVWRPPEANNGASRSAGDSSKVSRKPR
jgi:hypothetical protein